MEMLGQKIRKEKKLSPFSIKKIFFGKEQKENFFNRPIGVFLKKRLT